jgi:YD repeat-containing protein
MTIAKQLKIKEFPFEIKDSKNNRIYWENSNGYWAKSEFDSNGKEIYYENSDGYWAKREYDSKGNLIYCENSSGFWTKYEYDSDGNKIYWEDSDGTIRDDRPKTDVQKAIELLTKEGLIADGKILKN